MLLTAWITLGLSVEFFCIWRYPLLIGRGRLLSRPLWRFRFFRPMVGYTMLLASRTRSMQMFVLLVVYVGLAFPLRSHALVMSALFWVVVIALYLDDYLTGDDERWRRFRRRLQRRVRGRLAAAEKLSFLASAQ